MKHIKTYNTISTLINNVMPSRTFNEWLNDYSLDINTYEIDCTNSYLTDLNGIEKFTKIENLFCSNNKLTSLPDLSNLTNIKFLFCSNNKLTSLPDLSNLINLQDLYCYDNKLTSLPDLSNLTNFNYLNCPENNLPYTDLEGYLEWHKKTYPWIWDSNKYNL